MLLSDLQVHSAQLQRALVAADVCSSKQRRATETPSWEAPSPQDRELTESRDANEALIALGPLRPSSSCSHKTNSGAVRNWLRPDVPSGLRALRRADQENCRSSRCSRIRHTCEDEATNRPPSCNLRSHLHSALNQDLFLAEISSLLKTSLAEILGQLVAN
jgi:hypothetical protein